jgi:hypothetical protein
MSVYHRHVQLFPSAGLRAVSSRARDFEALQSPTPRRKRASEAVLEAVVILGERWPLARGLSASSNLLSTAVSKDPFWHCPALRLTTDAHEDKDFDNTKLLMACMS